MNRVRRAVAKLNLLLLAVLVACATGLVFSSTHAAPRAAFECSGDVCLVDSDYLAYLISSAQLAETATDYCGWTRPK